jgi:ribonuclease III
MPKRSAPSRTRSTTSTSTPPDETARPAPGAGVTLTAGAGSLNVSHRPTRSPDEAAATVTVRMNPAAALAARLGLPLGESELLRKALVHSSYLHEHPDAAADHNERLEFLGDAVVSLAISEALYARHPTDDEGFLSARRAAIVSTPGLAAIADRLDLGSELLLGEGEAQRGGRSRPGLLESAFEALVGALYMELGYERVRTWLLALAAPEIGQDLPEGLLKSPKSRLQEYTQRTTGGRPIYRVVDASGPDHERTFQIVVEVEGEVLGEGTGPSRRVAETAAALMALEAIRAGAAHLD